MDVGEEQRLLHLTKFESMARARGFCYPAGVDEAGRGPLAGPVTAAACIIPDGVFLEGADDSKKLSEKHRNTFFQRLADDSRIIWAWAAIESAVIDQINILQATMLAMRLAVDSLDMDPDYLLVDGLDLAHPLIPGEKIIKGDQRSQSIAAASIIAKVKRDELMLEYHAQWPEYGFAKHKGYGTQHHLEALRCHGPCPIHRRSFRPVAECEGVLI
ncbi:MAG: ribonuclease HII [Chlamydiia bacterium]|nr:ribonuclease HII [Chlamydiia bacterium]